MRVPVTALQPPIHAWAAEHNAETHASALIGQVRAVTAVKQALNSAGRYAHGFIVTPAGLRTYDVLKELQQQQRWQHAQLFDWVYLANPKSAHEPICVNLPAGTASEFLTELWAILEAPVEARQASLKELQAKVSTPRITAYLAQIAELSFADLPGNELATIIVEHQDEEEFVLCDRVTEASLFGSIRLQSVQGTISSDLHLIEAGALLKANGGVLAIDAEELLSQPGLWRKLKYILKTSQFHWPQPGDANIAAFYQPEPVPIQIKILLLGDRDIYAQLRELDRDFDNLFPYLCDFSAHYPLSTLPLKPYFDYLAYVQHEADVLPLQADAIPLVLKFASRLSDYQTELSLDTIALMQFLREANVIATAAQDQAISGQHLARVLEQRQQRDGYIAELSRRSILEGQVYIETQGAVVGQINGLTVVTAGGSEFGEPSRITATVHYGDGDIIDIDRKSELSGNIHTKGVMILSAYIANVFARNETMALSATIVFEQSYHEVDGDSASLAELCCLLSALAEAPIQQGLAITGAVDQFGQVQAIGAVNEKIEGFYELCAARGLTGQQGVIIPAANLSQLNLEPHVIAAVERGEFTVYAVKHLNEALELLTQADQKGLYEKIEQRLRELQPQEPSPSVWQRWFGS
ncbi:Lon protease family protein [Pseudidiomarina aestuarii]|uniref:endopeptidase La n=1 Tax=Pseudidiomarina aestuarii TaxID=624146 RepID=A0A7Z6ZU31_9GAMM|nr:Lon protease family protein [Pseudidiomarina aestuarii]RUO41085.1 Lon protease family protein [Pseudidiomarina aestuarii]